MRNLTIIRFMKEGHATQSRIVNFMRGGPLYAHSTCTHKCQRVARLLCCSEVNPAITANSLNSDTVVSAPPPMIGFLHKIAFFRCRKF